MNDMYQQILNQMHEGIYYCDKNRIITFWNDAATKITGYTKDEMIGMPCYGDKLQHIDDRGCVLCEKDCPLKKTMQTGQTSDVLVYLHHKEGHRVPVNLRITPTFNNRKEVDGAIELFTEQTSRLEALKEIVGEEKEKYIDKLTGFANKEFATIRLKRRLDKWKELNIPFAVFFVNIEDMENIIDSHGQEKKNEIIKMVSRSINGALKPIDILCRWGDTSFIVINPNVNQESVKNMGNKIKLFVDNSWIENSGENNKIGVKVSIGCSYTNNKKTNLDDVIKSANSALESSKKLNGASIVVL